MGGPGDTTEISLPPIRIKGSPAKEMDEDGGCIFAAMAVELLVGEIVDAAEEVVMTRKRTNREGA